MIGGSRGSNRTAFVYRYFPHPNDYYCETRKKPFCTHFFELPFPSVVVSPDVRFCRQTFLRRLLQHTRDTVRWSIITVGRSVGLGGTRAPGVIREIQLCAYGTRKDGHMCYRTRRYPRTVLVKRVCVLRPASPSATDCAREPYRSGTCTRIGQGAPGTKRK